ncbi:MAG: alpha-amylase family glycosyl hydrolase [Acidobacteriota bacterium]|nr:alpha-amylase family glycosyl hydrolase [Acidobacteriota bacterium]
MTDFEKHLRDYFPFELPVSAAMDDWLELAALFKEAGAHSLSDAQLLRRLAARFNARCAASAPALNPVSPGQLVTAGMIVDLQRYVTLVYCYRQNPGSLGKGLSWTAARRSAELPSKPVAAFAEMFPPRRVLLAEEAPSDYLNGRSEISSHRETAAMESVLLMLAMINPAFKPFRAFFDDARLRKAAPYRKLVGSLSAFFKTQPPVAESGISLLGTLTAPMKDSPDSLGGQLEYIRRHWAKLLPASLLEKVLLAGDILREERFQREFGPGRPEVLRFGKGQGPDTGYPEVEAFSLDANWMSNVVLIAKSTYVWLDQLSRTYERPVRHLDEIPDEELDRLRRWGFTGLWLIGIWERSPASQAIKKIMGNPEALASAYSLYDYTIAHDLGGDAAYENLRERAGKRGIRLSADMVPNHMGIYSRWVVEHPEWFIQTPYPPFPAYQFTGVDLSGDSRAVLQIEDGYWQRRDAAVVFKRIDAVTGEARYIYHGNDGTNMPWNDTAQLNFLLPEVREAVIQTILHVARMFPIIRFDAAMTLAKRHYQRLWYPLPGEGGAVPSRAEHGLSRDEFDARIPKEFWREVVDRVQAEVPQTLLLAEAFWLMEGYFVRTLGMHRVYNSAFMNMLKMEENAKYRQTVKNVLEFSPEVLKRFVNFMNNPDELTAVEQFGKGDKYFGVAMMMVTMPGLPMIGHGQVEGFAEKYGMEYRRAYWDEKADADMVRRHESEIFPLMRRRRLFSGVENFAFYDFHSPQDGVNENVFAYSNRAGEERALILYNNVYQATRGWIRASTPINTASGDSPHLARRSLAEALDLRSGEADLYVFRDQRSGLQYIRSGRRLSREGFYAELCGYQYQAFLDWREIHDHDGSWRRLMDRLNDAGTPDIDDLYRDLQLQPVLGPLRAAVNAEALRAVGEMTIDDDLRAAMPPEAFLEAVAGYLGGPVVRSARPRPLPAAESKKTAAAVPPKAPVSKVREEWDEFIRGEEVLAPVLVARVLEESFRLKNGGDERGYFEIAFDRLEDWHLRRAIAQAFAEYHGDGLRGDLDGLLAAALVTTDDILDAAGPDMDRLLDNPYVRRLLAVNVYDGIEWFSKEGWDRLIRAYAAQARLRLSPEETDDPGIFADLLERYRRLIAAGERSGYRFARLKDSLAGRADGGTKEPV